jgi:hypothetical protein
VLQKHFHLNRMSASHGIICSPKLKSGCGRVIRIYSDNIHERWSRVDFRTSRRRVAN